MSDKKQLSFNGEEPASWFAFDDFVQAMQKNVQDAHSKLEAEAEGTFLQVANVELEVPVLMHAAENSEKNGNTDFWVRTYFSSGQQTKDGDISPGLEDERGGMPDAQVGRVRISFKQSHAAFKS